MTRVSQLELYNDKDIITQICMMKQMVETGTYAEVRVISTGGNYVFEFEDQNGDVQTFTVPAKQISGVTSSQSGSTVTMRITYTDSSYTDVSWTAGGDVTTNTNQTISAVKTFSVSPIVPDSPSGTHAAVNVTYVSKTDGTNNLLHTSANETAAGVKQGIWHGYRLDYPQPVTQGKWLKFASIPGYSHNGLVRIRTGQSGNNIGGYFALAQLSSGGTFSRTVSYINQIVGGWLLSDPPKVAVNIDSDYNLVIWIYISDVNVVSKMLFELLDYQEVVTYYNTEENDAPLSATYILGSA